MMDSGKLLYAQTLDQHPSEEPCSSDTHARAHLSNQHSDPKRTRLLRVPSPQIHPSLTKASRVGARSVEALDATSLTEGVLGFVRVERVGGYALSALRTEGNGQGDHVMLFRVAFGKH